MKDLRSRLVRGVPQNSKAVVEGGQEFSIRRSPFYVLLTNIARSTTYYVSTVPSIAVRSTTIESPVCGILQILYVAYNTVFLSNDKVYMLCFVRSKCVYTGTTYLPSSF